jgi:hypothetical protein
MQLFTYRQSVCQPVLSTVPPSLPASNCRFSCSRCVKTCQMSQNRTPNCLACALAYPLLAQAKMGHVAYAFLRQHSKTSEFVRHPGFQYFLMSNPERAASFRLRSSQRKYRYVCPRPDPSASTGRRSGTIAFNGMVCNFSDSAFKLVCHASRSGCDLVGMHQTNTKLPLNTASLVQQNQIGGAFNLHPALRGRSCEAWLVAIGRQVK